MSPIIETAATADVAAIARVIRANRDDPSLFQQTPRSIRAALADFLVARCDGEIAGCVRLRRCGRTVEILSVAVDPARHGQGLGSVLIDAALSRARGEPDRLIWLGTAKPGYFARHGFEPMSRWRLPIRVLLHKLVGVFGQPIGRWLPAIFGRHVFMQLAR